MDKIIDLRSDTVTKPSPDMLEFMLNARVGDDVFEDDPTVMELQEFAAEMFGMEAALYCPSGTMTNQIGIKVLSELSPQNLLRPIRFQRSFLQTRKKRESLRPQCAPPVKLMFTIY